MDIYRQNGYENRMDYLESLSDEYNIDFDIVMSLANVLGENEDFDGLVSMIQDAEAMML